MRVLTAVAARLIDLVVPLTCAACGLPGAGVCDRCRRALAVPRPPACRRCGHPWSVPTASCAECPVGIDDLRFAVAYEDPAPDLIRAFKDARRRALARDLAGVVTEGVDPVRNGRLVPVPVGRGRTADRGFNQSALLAAELGRRWGLPVADVLVRRGTERPQRGAAASARRENVRGAFAVAAGLRPPEIAWLVDDVCTTGATLAACAATLRRAGANRVGAVCVARVLR